MIRLRAHRAAVSLLTLSVVASGIAVVGTTGAASAAPHYETPPSVQIGYTDSATPRTAYDAGQQDLPLGTWPDAAGVAHTSRVYATFDLASFEGRKIYGGSIFVRESGAADCSKRAIEIWRTKPVDGTPTWKRAPAPLAKVDEITTPESCANTSITFDVGAAVQDAVQKRQRRITFEIRVPAQYETDPSYGRKLYWYNKVQLSVQQNAVPTIDNNHLYNGGFPCTALKPYPRLGYFASSLAAVGADADPADERHIETTVAIWPTGQPANRAEFTGDNGISGRANGVGLPTGTLVDGTSYVWQARVGDGTDVSDWSRKCYFTYDRTNPSTPTVTSSNYPKSDGGQQTPLGVPGSFTFSGGGNRDVAGFAYSWQSSFPGIGCPFSGEFGQLECEDPFTRPGTVRANAPGGSATVTLSPPWYGTQTLYVRAIDPAGNVSPSVSYELWVPESTPTVTTTNGAPKWDQQVQLRFSPKAGITATEYRYTLDSGESQTVQADDDGYGYFSFRAGNPNGHQVKVRSVSANGFVSAEANWYASFDPWAGVSSEVYPGGVEPTGGIGVPGDFTFSPPPGWTDTTTYQYTWGDGVLTEVAAGPDGRATITWTPTVAGTHMLRVYAVHADGTWGDYANSYWFEVAGTA